MRPILARSHADLLERPLLAHMATVRPDGQPQSTVVRFDWDGRRLRVSLSGSARQLANLEHEPRAAFSIVDPDEPARALELRSVVETVEDDADLACLRTIASRYGRQVGDQEGAERRVAISCTPTSFLALEDGTVVKAR